MPLRNRLRILAVSGLALFTVSASLPPASAHTTRSHHPSGGGLSAVIRYTEYGIPHIVAKDYANLGFGNGWAQAADQVCTLADGFVTLRGERSRYFGPDAAPDGSLSSATKNMSSDLFFRGVRDSRTVEKLLEVPAPAGPSRATKELQRGWADGYNAWLAQNRITDPACRGARWVRPVTTLDVTERAFALSVLGGQGRGIDGITAAEPPAATPAPAPTPPSPDDAADAAARLLSTQNADMGSNAVAFRGSTTAGGRGLLLGNPHYPWQGGRRFWQSQQTIPGELNVAGGSLLGSATMSIGHNAHVAWSHTVATGVTLNLHQLTLDPADPAVYVVDGKPERMTQRTVSVDVGDGRKVTRTQWWTRYGPVVTSLGAGLPLPWTRTTAYALGDPNAVNLRSGDTALGFSKAHSTHAASRRRCAVRRGCRGSTRSRPTPRGTRSSPSRRCCRGSRTSSRSAARRRWAGPPTRHRGSPCWTVRGATARRGRTRTPYSPGSSARAGCPPWRTRRTSRTPTTAPG